MLRIKLLALCACLHFIAVGQDISGVINTYHKVTKLTNTNAESSVEVDNVTGLKILDKVMIIQMKGAKVDESDNSNFGKLTSNKDKQVGINNAGNYEIALICRIQGNKVFFINKILKTYDVAGKVQLVKIPKYTDAVVAGSIDAAPWDSASGKGGVLAISVAGTLTLNGKITADGKGFKGGKFLKSVEGWLCAIGNGYVYNPAQLNPQWGAYKGESVAALSLSKSGGRGAAANGGGGGNNHNTGGGGGSNAGAGGGGGANEGGSCVTSHYGIGGYPLSADGTRLFLGGGGGAGHGNNTVQTGGGNGGGIIFIEAKTLVGNGYDITSNGQNGSNTTGDGGSGGGGGGSIIMNVTTFTGAVAITAKGGNGGKVDHDVSGYCFDGGGGGGGGIVYFKGIAPAGVSVIGGAKGGRSGIFSCSGQEGTSKDGGIGLVVPGFSLDAPGPVAASCPEATALPVGLITFEAYLKENKTTLRWQIAEPKDAKQFIIQRKAGSEEWKDISTLPAQSGVAAYTTTDATITEGNYQYRLQIIEQDGKVVYSPIRSVSLAVSRNGQLVIYPNPATSEITIVKNSGMASLLEIFDATGKLVFQKQVGNSNVIHQDVTFLQKGLYIVKLDGTAQRLIIGQ